MHAGPVQETNEPGDEDPLLAWAAQGQSRAYSHGDAFAVASPALYQRDRLAVTGSADDLAVLVPKVLAEVGPSYRTIGDAPLIRELADRVPGVTMVDTFGWMETSRRPAVVPSSAGWLTDEDDRDIGKLLDAAWPSAKARPRVEGVRRWAGLRDCGGRLAAVAADAWSAPTVGFLSGAATHPQTRGRGHSAATCGFLVDEMLSEYGRVGLLVDGWNCGAIRLFRRLGLTYRPLASLRVR